MRGIENITGRIEDDARRQGEEIIAKAKGEALELRRKYEEQAEQLRTQELRRAKTAAEQRVQRLAGVADLEARKCILSARQEMLGEAFEQAAERLRDLPAKEKTEFLAKLAAGASRSGQEEIVLNGADAKKVGAAVVKRANELLGEKGGLTLSSQPRELDGLMLSEGDVEVNCTVDTLLRQARDTLSVTQFLWR